jgi:hypothetical protein
MEKRKKETNTAPADLRRSVRIRERCARQELEILSSTAIFPSGRTRQTAARHMVSYVVPVKRGATAQGISTRGGGVLV